LFIPTSNAKNMFVMNKYICKKIVDFDRNRLAWIGFEFSLNSVRQNLQKAERLKFDWEKIV